MRFKISFALISIFLLLSSESIYPQGMHNKKKIISLLGYTAKSYLLTANRPGIGINAYMTPKKKISIEFSASFNNEYVETPLSLEYGVTNGLNLLGGISLYTQSYDFSGNRISGLGDSYIGVKFKIQESEYFIHSFQAALKIPTASKTSELGTGKMDLHIGLAQGFSYNRFSYELSTELNLLKRRDFPNVNRILKVLLQSALDSLKNVYNYKYEPEFVVSFSPAYDIGENAVIYTGVSFSRNFRLDFNTSQISTGFGYYFSDKVSASAGASFGLLNEPGWSVSAGIFLTL
jgi:hypothetical protein